jgi:transcriptional regulator with XRE-family HTH domain
MAKAPEFDWYLIEWMDHLNVTQADLCRATGFPKAKMSELANGVSRYNRDVINTLAAAMNVRPYELLMPPDLAAAFKKYLASAQDVVTLAHEAEEPVKIGMEAARRKLGRKPEGKRAAQ